MLERKGLSPDGVNYVAKALHPAGVGHTVGVPDEELACSVTPELRSEKVISCPSMVAASQGNWDLLIWKPPTDSAHYFYATGPSGTNFAGLPPSSRWNADPVPTIWSDNWAEWVTAQPNVGVGFFQGYEIPAYEAAGSPVNGIDPAETNLIVHVGTRVFGILAPEFQPTAWRTTHSSLTCYMTASDLYNQGSVHAAQFPSDFKRIDAQEMNEALSFAGPPGFGNITEVARPGVTLLPEFLENSVHPAVQRMATTVPFDEETMYKQSPKVYAGQAKEGIYMPLCIVGDHPYVTNDETPTTVSVKHYRRAPGMPGSQFDEVIRETGFRTAINLDVLGNPDAYIGRTSLPVLPVLPVNRVMDKTTGRYMIAPVCTENALGTNAAGVGTYFHFPSSTPFSSGLDNVNQGVVIFRGLDYRSTIVVKSILGLEIIPTTLSPLLSMVKEPANNDPRARALYDRVVHATKDVYPAEFNDFGSIINEIASVIGDVVGVAAPIVGAFAPEALPFLGIAEAAAQATKAATRRQGQTQAQTARTPRARAKTARVMLKKPAPKMTKRR